MASEVFQLAILLSVKDAASGSLDRFSAKLRAMGKDGAAAVQELDKIRANLNRDLAIGGVGVAGLAILKKGVDEAGNYEATLLDLKTAYQEVTNAGGRSADLQSKDLTQLSALATRLGSDLMGGTSDYVQILTAMKKAGVDVETVLDGAGDAAAKLANITKTITSGGAADQAKDLGQYGKMFDLKGREYLKAVELFSGLSDRFDISSSELTEGSKYFFSTAKSTLGLRGMEGASETAKLLAFSKRYAGFEGSRGGTNLDSMITEFLKHEKPRESLKADKGIDLQLFDEKGSFKGIDNMFSQLEKLKKLSAVERSTTMQGIFGTEGARIASAMVEQGVQGWRNITEEANKSVSVNDKINAQMQTYNAKTEALSGSWQNFKATAFTPLMQDAKEFVDYGSKIVNSLQKFSSENPGLTKMVTEFAALGSGALVLYGGFKTLTTGVQLFRLASAVSTSGGLLQYLNQTSVAANAAGTSITTATTRATGLRGALQNQSVRIGVQIGAIMGIEYLIGVIQREIQKAFDAGEAKKNAVEATNKGYTAFQQAEKDGAKFSQKDLYGQASTTWFSVMHGGLQDTLPSEARKKSFGQNVSTRATETYLYPLTKWAGAENPFKSGFGGNYNSASYAQGFKKTAPELADPRIMSEFLQQMRTRVEDRQERKPIVEGLQGAFPESFAAAMRELSTMSFDSVSRSVAEFQEQLGGMSQSAEIYNQQGQAVQTFGQNLDSLQMPIAQTQNDINNLAMSAQRVPPPLNGIAVSANSASNSLNSLSEKIAGWQPPTPQIQTITIGVPAGAQANPAVSTIPSHAVGGIVEKDGLAMVHAGNVISPAKTKGIEGVSRLLKSVETKNGVNSFSALTQNTDARRSVQIEDARRILSTSSSRSVVVNYSPNLTINGGLETAKADFQASLNDHSREIERIVARQMENGRARA